MFGYILSVAAELLYSLTTGRPLQRGPVAVAAVALGFSLWMAGATGADAVQSGTVMLLLGIPAYVLIAATRARAAPPPPR